MRFSLSSTALSSKLSALSRVINSKSSLPILGESVFNASIMENDSIRSIERVLKHISELDEQEVKLDNGKTTVEQTEFKRKFSKKEQVETTEFTDSPTLQSDSTHAQKGLSQPGNTKEEGNNAQRGCCGTYQAVFRVVWSGCHHEEVRRDEGGLRWQSGLAGDRQRSDGLLNGEEKTGYAGRWRAAAADGSGMDSGNDQWCKWWASGLSDRKQCSGTLLFGSINHWRA